MAVFEQLQGGQEMSEYEKMVRQNIFENQDVFGNDIDECIRSVSAIVNVAKSTDGACTTIGELKTRKRSYSQKWNRGKVVLRDAPTFVRRSARINVSQQQNYNENSDDDDGEEQTRKKSRNGSLRLKFEFFSQNKYLLQDQEFYSRLSDSDFVDFGDEESEELESSRRPGRRSSARVPRLAVRQVTQSMINNITYRSSMKIYGENGTTCHQCRQKTLDQKSYCRHLGCRGARGMFCGFCLFKRYGENLAEVLMNPRWACPPCRGHCNCSICRRRSGLNPTGQMAQLAEAGGFKSVHHLLNNVKGESSNQSTSNVSDDDNVFDDDNVSDNENESDDENKFEDDENKSDDDENKSDDDENKSDDDDSEDMKRKQKEEDEKREEEFRQMRFVIFGEEDTQYAIGRKSVKDFDHEKENLNIKLVEDQRKEFVEASDMETVSQKPTKNGDNVVLVDDDSGRNTNLNYVPKAWTDKYVHIFDNHFF